MIDQERCKKVVNAIRDLGQNEIEELFKLIHKEQCHYTKTIHGIFFNLSWVSEETMQKIEQFISFCHTNNRELDRYESLCDVLNHKLYEGAKTSNNDQNQNQNQKQGKSLQRVRQRPINATEQEDSECKKNIQTKVSSSMRFYLLKKRFSKPIIMTTTYENDLMPEEYVL